MTDLRTAAQQALEALVIGSDAAHEVAQNYHEAMAGYRPARHIAVDDDVRKIEAAITALKAALVEDAMQKFTDVNQELEAALGCDHCNSPLYAAVKCRVCGRVTEPVQEPVAWMHVPYPGNGMSPLVSRSEQREPSMYAASVPLYLKEQL